MENQFRAIEDLARTTYANVVWTHKIQEKQAEINECKFTVWSVINIIASALTSAGIFAVIFLEPLWLKIASAVLSFLTTGASAFISTFSYKEKAIGNKSSAVKLVEIRDELLVLLVQIRFQRKEPDELMNEYTSVRKKLQTIYEEAPNTSGCAVNAATKIIANENGGVYTDEQVDELLPAVLRRNNNGFCEN